MQFVILTDSLTKKCEAISSFNEDPRRITKIVDFLFFGTDYKFYRLPITVDKIIPTPEYLECRICFYLTNILILRVRVALSNTFRFQGHNL